jgi:NAD(P)H dehydrogenase (quinone)
MAQAVAEGARSAGATVDIKRVPELVPEATAKASHFKMNQPAPVAKIDELANYDAIVIGTGTRFGRMASQMGNFLDQAGTNLLHFGMVVLGLDYGHAGQMTLNEITGGSPYGATTVAGGDGSRQPTANELVGARYQVQKIAETAKKLHG